MSAAPVGFGGRVRLKDAAIERVASDGLNVSRRSTAFCAGVSAGLVPHHFGSNQVLRTERAAAVLKRYRLLPQETFRTASDQLFARLLSSRVSVILLVHILRSVPGGGAACHEISERLVAETLRSVWEAVSRGIIISSRDEEARVRFLGQKYPGVMVLGLATCPNAALGDFGAVMEQYYADAMLSTLGRCTEDLFADRRHLDGYEAHPAGIESPAADPAGGPAA